MEEREEVAGDCVREVRRGLLVRLCASKRRSCCAAVCVAVAEGVD